MNSIRTEAVVIGAGPGGYVCAIRLAQLGVKTLLVERGPLGGVCLNVGCIPSKALISASKLVSQMGEADTMGISSGPVNVDVPKLIEWKRGIVKKLTSGVGQLVKGNGGEILHGEATFLDAHTLSVRGADGEETRVEFQSAVIATGSTPSSIPGFEPDGTHILTSTEGLELQEVPKRMLVIGGGYIGMELGGVWQRLGSEVTVVEFADQILPGFAKDVVRPVQKRFKKGGGVIHARTAAKRWEQVEGGGVRVFAEPRDGGDALSLEADAVLLTVGRFPNSAGIGLEALGLTTDERGFIPVDGEQRTAVPNIYAIGDVAGEPMLAHKGSREGEVAAEVIAGQPSAFDCRGIPAVVFTDPEIATVGLTAAEAKEKGLSVRLGKFGFAANGRALSMNEGEGFARLIVDSETEVVIGAEVVGPEASNLIAEIGLALEMGALASDVALTIHAHPTLSEAWLEAAAGSLGHGVHSLNRS
ncbi:MAG: dihydrolipoyl dehydrogenase [Myxococcota bacterium]|nr:dihydrolipoyl dehydrogenase [Myxococcota bacterium]